MEPLTAVINGHANTVKPGWKTTEFWAAIAVVVLTNLDVIKLPAKYDGLVAIAALIGYQISRGIAKAGADELAPKELHVPLPVPPNPDEVDTPSGGAA